MRSKNTFGLFLIVAFAALYAKVAFGVSDANRFDANNPPNTDIYRNLEYASVGDTPLLLDLYIPQGAKKPMPLLIWIHGGGWWRGSKAKARPVELGFLEKGYAAASVEYRFTDKAIFPAQIYDCKAAVRFLRGNAGKYGLDPKRFGVWGESAGGHLVALMGTTSDSKVLDGNEGSYLNESSAIQAVCDFCGSTDFLKLIKENPDRSEPNSNLSKFLGGRSSEHLDTAAKASPITYVSKNSPPFLIVHGGEDNRVPLSQSEKFYEALKKAGADAELKILAGAGHGGPAFRDPNLVSDIQTFFDKNLK